MKLSKNKGEWSEFYAFLKLLSTGKLYAADEETKRIENVYFPIIRIIRNESDKKKEYVIQSDDGQVEVHIQDELVRLLASDELCKMAKFIYESIVAGKVGSGAFEIDGAKEVMDKLSCTEVSAPGTSKSDITMQVHDIQTGYNPVYGFSIKSELGSSPTLLNPCKATNFVFEVSGISEERAKYINDIDTKTKIIDRIRAILESGSMKYSHLRNKEFNGNLVLIDSFMDEIVGEILYDYYLGNSGNCRTLIERIETKNPLGYKRKGVYEYKFKKFLCSIALGMTAATEWDGRDVANGGYIIVKVDGDVVAYHIYNRDAFETYLLNNTKLDRASTTRYDYATIYEEDGKSYIDLNLQIRFI